MNTTITLILQILFSCALAELIDPKTIPKFVTQIPISAPVFSPLKFVNNTQTYHVKMKRVFQQILPQSYPKTEIFAYGGKTHDRLSQANTGEIFSFPGPQFIFTKNVAAYVVWENLLEGKHLFNIERNLDFMNSSEIDFDDFIPTVAHAHGMATHYSSDGHPGAWFTSKYQKGVNFYEILSLKQNQAAYFWTNQQDDCTLFYHDHAAAMTRLNVYAGLQGFLSIYDQNSILNNLFNKTQDIYLSITDKTFNRDGSLYYPEKGMNPKYPNWTMQFFGNVMVVNGKSWPIMNVQRRAYRLRILNGCNSRFLKIQFRDSQTNSIQNFFVCKIDSSYYGKLLAKQNFILYPSTRVEIVFDFSKYSSGSKIIMYNKIGAPYPVSQSANFDPQTTGKIMMFQLFGQAKQSTYLQKFIEPLNPLLDTYPLDPHQPIIKRYHVLYQKKSENQLQGSEGLYIDGIDMSLGPEIFHYGRTYDLYITNLSEDTHPMHFHLINFQLVMKARINTKKFTQDWLKVNSNRQIPFNTHPKMIDPVQYMQTEWQNPQWDEKNFRDVDAIQPGWVHVWRIRFAHNDGRMFSFNPRAGEFMWHCHMLQHQDFSMMRQFKLV